MNKEHKTWQVSLPNDIFKASPKQVDNKQNQNVYNSYVKACD